MEFEGERTFDLLGKGDPIVKLVGRRVYLEVRFGIGLVRRVGFLR